MAELERTIRDRIEASRPRPPIEAMRDRARAASMPPALINFTTPLPRIRWNNASLRDILNSIADVTGINITYDREVTDRQATVQLDGVTLEQALNQLMQQNQLSYKVINERSIFVFQDIATKHGQYDEQVVRVFYVSHADATELTGILSTIVRLPGIAIQPAIVANKSANTITVRATAAVVQILEKIIQQNDKPRAEIVVDVSILEVDRSRTKTYGINLSDYALGMVFSPEVSPNGAVTTPTTGTTPAAGGTTTPTTTSATGSTGPTGVKQHGGFLSGRPDSDRQFSRERHAYEDHREAAAPWRRGREADAEARRLDSDHFDELHTDRHGRRRRQPAQLVSVQRRRHHR